MLNPVFTNAKATLAYIVIWVFIAALHFVVLLYFMSLDWQPALIDAIFSNLLFAFFGVSIWYFVRYVRVDDNTLVALIVNHFSAALVLAGVWTALTFFVYDVIFGDDSELHLFFKKSSVWRYASGLLYYFVLTLIYYLYIYYDRLNEQKVSELNLQNLVRETKLSYLKSQLNPHFLFNSLNSIASLTISEPEMAYDMILKLSSFLRFTLDQKEHKRIAFRDEIKNSMYYLDIEKIRFDERLCIENHIDDDCADVLVPNMILQPLYENAVKYSVQESTDEIRIITTARIIDGFLHISIKNDKTTDVVVRKGQGIGIKNIKHRLLIIYNRNDLFRVNESDTEFEVVLYVPV